MKEVLNIIEAMTHFLIGCVVCLFPFMLLDLPGWVVVVYLISLPVQTAVFVLWSRSVERRKIY